jgi:hypothetical protein
VTRAPGWYARIRSHGEKHDKPARPTLVEWVTAAQGVEFAFKDIPLP